jgi:hypothetical protein
MYMIKKAYSTKGSKNTKDNGARGAALFKLRYFNGSASSACACRPSLHSGYQQFLAFFARPACSERCQVNLTGFKNLQNL